MPSTPNLLLQFVILGVLAFGILRGKKGHLNMHGYIAFAAVALNALSIIVVMLPSASRIMAGASQSGFTMIVAVHSLLGFIVEALGAYIVLRWRFQTPGPTCWKMKSLMRVLAALWTLSVLLGALVYYMLL
jgi:uncharacterized membrane protein YozB (DUF420 family)